MAVFCEVTTDSFENVLEGEAAQRKAWSDHSAGALVRRPTRGLEIKEETPAALKVIDAAGSPVPLVSSTALDGNPGAVDAYTNFILQQVQEVRMEKHQIVETFGESYIFFFGESPRFLDVQVVIINSFDFNWEAEWWENYEKNFRGTKLVERGARLYMFYDDNVVEGYMLNAQASKLAEEPHKIVLSFRMYVTSYRNISFIGDTNYPTHRSVTNEVAQQYRAPGSRVGAAAALAGDAASKALDQNFADAQRLGIISPRADNTNTTPSSDALTDGIINSPGRETAQERALRRGQAYDPERSPDYGGKTPEQLADSANREALQNEVGQKSSLSRLLRAAPASGSFSPEVLRGIEQSGGLNSVLGGLALRSRISDNIDEYLSSSTYSTFSDLPNAQAPTIRTQQEVEDLWLATVASLACYGADINNQKSLHDLGLMPKFGADARGKATFRASASASASFGLGTSSSSTPRRDPLGAVFGRTDVGINDRSTVQGAGDSEYGYSSDYGRTPGVGRPGYGDYGGNGFGSGQGAAGDPGFKDPKKFSFLGVQGSAAAFSRFNKPKPNNTAFAGASARVSLGESTSGLPGGASTRLEGQPSAFAIVSTGGVFGEPLPPADTGALAQAGAGARARVSAGGVFVAQASASVHLGLGFGHAGGERCPPQGLSLTAGASLVAGASAGVGL